MPELKVKPFTKQQNKQYRLKKSARSPKLAAIPISSPHLIQMVHILTPILLLQ
jgi:hypothetical protein